MNVVGLLLAAGRGSRMGMPKALVRSASGVPWIQSSHDVLLQGGCEAVIVVVGAQAEAVRLLIPAVRTVRASDWELGMGESLAAGIRAVQAQFPAAEALVVHLVDLPDVGSDVVARVLEHASGDALMRARFGDHVGHPVLIGKSHWPGLLEGLHGDEGARRYLVAHGATTVDCTDLADGHDVDTPEGI